MSVYRSGDSATYSPPLVPEVPIPKNEEHGWELIKVVRTGDKEAVEGVLEKGPVADIYLNPALKTARKQQRQDIIEVIMKHAQEHPYKEKNVPLCRAIIISPKKERKPESQNPDMVRIVAPITGVAIAAFGIYLASLFI